jgi:hypothetical protein
MADLLRHHWIRAAGLATEAAATSGPNVFLGVGILVTAIVVVWLIRRSNA